MTVRQLPELGLYAHTPLSDTPVTGVYCGDLLSHVMGKAPDGCAWVTVMNNVNVVAVATLADVACIVLADGTAPLPEVVDRARDSDIALFVSDAPIFETALAIHRTLVP